MWLGWCSVQWWGDDRQVSQSGKPLCTGASLWAVPKLARGLRPLEPRHANGGKYPCSKSPPDTSSTDCTYGLAKALSPCTHQRGTLHSPLWNPLLILAETLWSVDIEHENEAEKGDIEAYEKTKSYSNHTDE